MSAQTPTDQTPYAHFTVRCTVCGCSATIGGENWRKTYQVSPIGSLESFSHRLRCSNCRTKASVEVVQPRLEQAHLDEILERYKSKEISADELEKSVAWLCKEGNPWAWEWWEGDDHKIAVGLLRPKRPISDARLSAYSAHLDTRTKQWLDWETGIGTKRMWQ